jgi:hypothetical protein
MDAQFTFRLFLIFVASVALVAIIVYYNNSMATAGRMRAPYHQGAVQPYEAFEANSPQSPRYPRSSSGAPPAPTEEDHLATMDDQPAPIVRNAGVIGAGNESIRAEELLPSVSPEANSFAALYPCGQGDLQGVNFLEAGSMIGQSTNLKRNANMQLRSDPPVPVKVVSIWNQSTIRPDCYQRRFDID